MREIKPGKIESKLAAMMVMTGIIWIIFSVELYHELGLLAGMLSSFLGGYLIGKGIVLEKTTTIANLISDQEKTQQQEDSL